MTLSQRLGTIIINFRIKMCAHRIFIKPRFCRVTDSIISQKVFFCIHRLESTTQGEKHHYNNIIPIISADIFIY
jgi:hypothetical protein